MKTFSGSGEDEKGAEKEMGEEEVEEEVDIFYMLVQWLTWTLSYIFSS